MGSKENIWLHHLKAGGRLFSEKNYPSAIDAFNKSIELNENNWKSYQGLGWAYFRIHKFNAAIDAFNKSIALNKNNWNSYYGLGFSLTRLKNFPAAIDSFNKSISLNENNWNSYYGLGFALSRIKNFAIAIDAFNKSIDLNENNWESYYGLGWAHSHTGNFQAAIDAFNKSIKLNHNDWNSYYGLGLSNFNIGNFQASIEALNKSIALKNTSWESYQGLGWAHFHLGNFQAAINAFNKSIKINETNHEAYQGLGFVLTRIKNFPAAIDALNKSINLSETCESYQVLGSALFCIKDYRKALDATNDAFTIKYSENIERQFKAIYSSAISEGKIDKKFTPFFKSHAALKEDFLKEYIATRIKTSKIDLLLLKHATLTIKHKCIEPVNSTELEILNNLKHFNSPTRGSTSILPSFHRYVFGNSHSRLHYKSPNTTIIDCGAGTMYSIADPEARTKHLHKINSALESIDHQTSILIFEFGEVDIRNHIFKVARKKSQSIFDTADTAISRYIDFINSLKKKGHNIMINGPHCGGGETPSRASALERNDLCAYINDALNLECQRYGFYFFTLFDIAVNQKTLKEISGLYYDNIHLHLPPTKIGCALNTILKERINTALSEAGSRHKFFQQEEVHAKCSLVISEIPNWQTGTEFYPGEEVLSKEKYFEIGQYMLLIELPFLMHPKEVTLGFKQKALTIKTAVHGVLESWDLSKETQEGNIIHGYSEHDKGLSKDNSIIHSFTLRNNQKEMCRFLIVRIYANAIGNQLTTISIKRWTHQFQQKRLLTIS